MKEKIIEVRTFKNWSIPLILFMDFRKENLNNNKISYQFSGWLE